MKILAINPGSTSTKIGIFNDETLSAVKVIRHTAEELSEFNTLIDQLDFRKKLILDTLKEEGLTGADFDGIIGRGGLLRPIEGGVYEVDDAMLHDLRIGLQGSHASNLGGLLAHAIAHPNGKNAYIADPVVVDELDDIARVTGHPLLEKVSIFHALNQKAIARLYCKEHNVDYTKVNLIVVHIGGGISVGIHKNGRVVDVNNALDGEGPFSPERSGTLPVGKLIDLCFSGKYTHKEVREMIQPKGGLVAYFGSNDFKDLSERMENDDKIRIVIDALLYQISKEIGSVSTVVKGKVDAILLTGGLVYSNYVSDYIKDRVSFIAPVYAYPGEDELSALASGILRVLRGEEQAKVY